MPARTARGFTLIELSTVLVILAMIVGGIVGARSLLRQSDLQSVIKELNGYKTAWNAFSAQYAALPGDFKRASQYFTGAYNGNGDAFIDRSVWPPEEIYYVWQHLSRAGMIPGSYTGEAEDEVPYVNIGVNMPPAKLTNAAYHIWTPHNPCQGGGNCQLYGLLGFGRAVLALGGKTNDYVPGGGVLTAAEAKSIDLKIDDGIANKGMLVTQKAWDDEGVGELDGCVDQSFNVSATTKVNYLLDEPGRDCGLGYWLEK